MSAPSHMTPIPEEVRERAAYWHVRLAAEEADEADWLAFEAWLGEAPSHLRAYEAVEHVWEDLDEAPASAASNVRPLRGRPTRRTILAGGCVAAGVAAVAVTGALTWTAPRPQVFDTAAGQPRQIVLADGTRITLNGGSHLSVLMRRHERRVVMADAEAAFDVAHDPTRPFYVEAGEREIRVVGTEFNVVHQQGDVSVAVRRGIVEVRPAGRPDGAPIARLTRGKVLTHRKGVSADRVRETDPELALAWTTGRLVFQDAPLAEVARTLSRYGERPVQVAPDAAGLPVTAVLDIASQEAMLQSLSEFLPVRIESRPDSVRLSLRR